MAAHNDSARVRVYEGHSIGSHVPFVTLHEYRTVTVGTAKRWLRDYGRRTGTYGSTCDERNDYGRGAVTFTYYVSGCPNNHRFVIVDDPSDSDALQAHRDPMVTVCHTFGVGGDRRPRVGDVILVTGQYAPVIAIRRIEPGRHPDSPIRDDMLALEYVTPIGSRWGGSVYGSFADELQGPRYLVPVSAFVQWCRDNGITNDDLHRSDPDGIDDDPVHVLVGDWVNSTTGTDTGDYDTVTEYASHCDIDVTRDYTPAPADSL